MFNFKQKQHFGNRFNARTNQNLADFKNINLYFIKFFSLKDFIKSNKNKFFNFNSNFIQV